MTDKMYRAFQECLELQNQGASLRECLARFPQYADELEPLLAAATEAPATSVRDGQVMSLEMRSRMRSWVLSEWDRQHKPRRNWFSFNVFSPRWAMATAAVLVMAVVLVGGAGTAAAAQEAIPGTALYPVKQLEEEARLWVTRSPEVKVARYGDLVRERAQELRLLAAVGDSESTAVAVSRMEAHIRNVSQLVDVPTDTEGTVQASLDPVVFDAIEEAIASKNVASGQVQDTLEQAPAEAYPCLRHTVRAIQQASQRVHDAVGQVRGEPSLSSSGFTGPLCP